MDLRHWLLAVTAAAGAYYLLAAAVLLFVGPFRYSLPQFGRIGYEPTLIVLGVVTAVGTAGAALVAHAYGGPRAVAAIATAYAAMALRDLLPHIADETAWVPPPDIHGITTATVLLLSYLVAVVAVPLGAIVAARTMRHQGAPPPALLAAGAYYLTSVAMSLPTPQLDLRLTFPFTADQLPAMWRFAVVSLPAAVAALFLSPARPLWHAAVIAAFIGLAGAAPGEITPVGLPRSPYVPTALVGVPILTGLIAIAVVVAKRAAARRSLAPLTPSPWVAAAAGAALAFTSVGAWALLASAPNPYHQTSRVETYRRSGDERKVVACVVSGVGDQVLGSSARESATTVAVTVRLRSPVSWYPRTLQGISLPVIVALREPLGSRLVVDESTGRPARETSDPAGPYGPWC